MQRYPDPKETLDRYVDAAALRYIAALHATGMEPNVTLMHAIVEQTVDEADRAHTDACRQVLEQNIEHVLRTHQECMNELARDRKRLAWIICVPMTLVMGVLAWLGFTHGQPVLACCYAMSALVFSAMFVHAAFTRQGEKRA